MADFSLSKVNFWPKWQRYAFIAAFLGAGLGLSWYWEVQPLRLQQSTLALAEIQLPQGGYMLKTAGISNANQAQAQLIPEGANALKKVLIHMFESDTLLLEKWLPSDQDWTLQISGAYSSIFNAMQSLAQGPIVWDLQRLKLQRLGPTSVRLSMVAKPLAQSHELLQTSSRYPSARGLQGQKQKPLFVTEDAPESGGKATQILASTRALPTMVAPMVLLGIVGLGGQEWRAIFRMQDTSYIVQKGDVFLDWSVLEIEEKQIQLKSAAGQVSAIDLFNSTAAAHEK